MNVFEQQLDYNKIQPSAADSSKSSKAPQVCKMQTFGEKLEQWGQRALQSLVIKQEPRVWTTTTSGGEVHWHLYDPVSRKHAVVFSEEDARLWVEAR